MKRTLCRFFFMTAVVMIPVVHAGGFQLYELGTPIIGTAGVGQAAVAQDASTSYFNPAAMMHLQHSELQLGSQMILSEVDFKRDDINTFSGNNGGNAGALLPGLGIFAVDNYCDDLKFGFSLATPFAGVVNYNDGWTGRFFVQGVNLVTLDANAALAYQLNDCIALGAGLFLEYAGLNEQIAIPGNPEGQADLRLQSYRPGFTLSTFIHPCDETKIGLNYRSAVKHKPNGRVTFLRLETMPAITSRLNLPQSITASLAQALSDNFTFLGEVAWANWSKFQNTNIIIDGITLPIQRNWKDTYRVGAGAQYRICPSYLLQAGISYDSSPCDAHNRLPDLPVDRQVRVGAGILFTSLEQVNFGLQYEYINLGKAAIHNSTRLGTLSGDYDRNFTNVFSFSVNARF